MQHIHDATMTFVNSIMGAASAMTIAATAPIVANAAAAAAPPPPPPPPHVQQPIIPDVALPTSSSIGTIVNVSVPPPTIPAKIYTPSSELHLF